MNCKEFQNELPDLILTPGARPSAAAMAHLSTCPPCTEELSSYAATFAALDSWTAPEPSPYFDGKMHVRLREEQAAPRMNWLESLKTRFLFNTGRQFRPAMAGVLALALVAAGGGSFLGLSGSHPAITPAAVQASSTVNDLQILDRNAQAFDQLEQLQQDDDSSATPLPTTPSSDAGAPTT